jgi:toxin HigB-1
MIKTFAHSRAQALYEGNVPKGFPLDVAKRAVVKLFLLDTVTRVEDLRVPPGNRLHRLTGDREGQWSISVNDQWRICFIWENGHAYHVEIVDYH